MRYFAGLDVGGTSARLKIKEKNGNILGEFFSKGCTINIEGYEESRNRYRTLVLNALNTLGLTPEECSGICLAASGVDNEETEQKCRNIFKEMGFGSEILTVCNDCEVMLRASDETDIVLVAGTGSIAFGRTENGEYVRCGGWGHILSDEGSAFDIAFRTFKLIGMHMDGRVSCPVLYRMFTEETGIKSVNEVNLYVNKYILDRPYIAKYALLAQRAAELGDSEAEKLLDDCADSLYKMICDTSRKIEKNDDDIVNVCFWGSVIKEGTDMSERLIRKISSEKRNFIVSHPDYTALDAALMTAEKNQKIY